MSVKTGINDQNTKGDLFPSLSQAILVEIKNASNVSISNILLEIANIVKPDNILLVAEYDFGYLIFLKSEDIAIQLHGLKVKLSEDKSVQLFRPFIPDRIQIILQNVFPQIPHENISKAFEKLEIYSLRDISFVNAGYKETELFHILSVERQGSILLSDRDKLRKKIEIEFDNTIYISKVNIVCPYHIERSYHDLRYCKYYPAEIATLFQRERDIIEHLEFLRDLEADSD